MSASQPPPQHSPMETTSNPKTNNKKISFFRNAVKNKHNFVQFFAMTGILLLSVRSLGQKYRIHDLQQDITALDDEKLSLSSRIDKIKSDLYREASLDSSGVFASRLRTLFGDNQ